MKTSLAVHDAATIVIFRPLRGSYCPHIQGIAVKEDLAHQVPPKRL